MYKLILLTLVVSAATAEENGMEHCDGYLKRQCNDREPALVNYAIRNQGCVTKQCLFKPKKGLTVDPDKVFYAKFQPGRITRKIIYSFKTYEANTCAIPNQMCSCNSRAKCKCNSDSVKYCRQQYRREKGLFLVLKPNMPFAHKTPHMPQVPNYVPHQSYPKPHFPAIPSNIPPPPPGPPSPSKPYHPPTNYGSGFMQGGDNGGIYSIPPPPPKPYNPPSNYGSGFMTGGDNGGIYSIGTSPPSPPKPYNPPNNHGSEFMKGGDNGGIYSMGTKPRSLYPMGFPFPMPSGGGDNSMAMGGGGGIMSLLGGDSGKKGNDYLKHIMISQLMNKQPGGMNQLPGGMGAMQMMSLMKGMGKDGDKPNNPLKFFLMSQLMSQQHRYGGPQSPPANGGMPPNAHSGNPPAHGSIFHPSMLHLMLSKNKGSNSDSFLQMLPLLMSNPAFGPNIAVESLYVTIPDGCECESLFKEQPDTKNPLLQFFMNQQYPFVHQSQSHGPSFPSFPQMPPFYLPGMSPFGGGSSDNNNDETHSLTYPMGPPPSLFNMGNQKNSLLQLLLKSRG